MASRTPAPEPVSYPAPCWWCNMLVAPDEDGRLFATHTAVEEPWVCPANRTGHRVRLDVNWEDTPELRAAWQAYDRVARALPQCEHVQAWQAELAEAKKVHHAAIRARDRLWTAQEKASDDPPGGAVAEDPEPGEGD
jgi:hypothetical protein